jgi:hypothetical protein
MAIVPLPKRASSVQSTRKSNRSAKIANPRVASKRIEDYLSVKKWRQ